MSSWVELESALDAIARRGEMIRFWWRDDDAGREHPALPRLIELAERHDAPLALAVVPTWLDGGTQGWIAASSSATVLQHGYAHVNHALNGGKSIELGGRGANAILDELRQGFEILCDAFGAAFLGVLAPPWNRIDPGLYHHLSAAGFHGLSIYGPRPAPFAASGVAQINTHLDPIDWRGTRLFVGEEAALERLIEVMAPEEPIGLLSHHLDMDEPGWAFFDRLLELLRRHPAARLCPAPALFAAEQDAE